MCQSHHRGWAEPEPDLAPERAGGRACCSALQRTGGYRWNRVGFGPGGSNGGSPGEQAGVEQRRKK